ncbi:MAG: ATP-binding cassette domain-containing protein [Clostridium sp.]|nr:ATP-binding cassette domain-containing protein [Clostridium sp.]
MKLEINNISKSYENKPVFSNLSFTFESDNLYLLKGKNGAGKSTLLNILSGNDLNYSGKLLLDGIEINKKNNISYTDEYINYFTQDSVVFDDMTCLDNILLPYPNKDKNRATELLNELGLSNCVDQNASNLSYGEKQRLALARGLYNLKPIMLFDEITSNLDLESIKIIMNMIFNLTKDHIIIFITHDESIDYLLSNYNLIKLENDKLNLIDSKTNNIVNKNMFSNSSVKENPSLIKEIASSLKINKPLYIFTFLFLIIFTALSIVFGGFYNTYNIDNRENIAFDNYLNSTPAIYIEDQDWINKDRIDDNSLFYVVSTNPKDLLYEYDEMRNSIVSLSGILSISNNDNYDDYGFHLSLDESGNIIGRYPKASNELIVSKDTYNAFISAFEKIGLSKSKAVDKLFNDNFDSYKIVGVYDPVLYDGYEYHKNAEFSEAIVSYNFMINTGFTIKENNSNFESGYVIKNTRSNRKLVSKSDINSIFLMLEEETDKNSSGFDTSANINSKGEYPYKGFDSYQSWNMLMWASFALISIYMLIIIISFYNKNKRIFLLLRISGMSRDRQIKNNLLTFSSIIISSLLIGFGLGSLVGFIIAKALETVFYPAVSLFNYYYLTYLIPLIIILVSVLLFYLVLSKQLSPKDLSKRLNEIKHK